MADGIHCSRPRTHGSVSLKVGFFGICFNLCLVPFGACREECFLHRHEVPFAPSIEYFRSLHQSVSTGGGQRASVEAMNVTGLSRA